MPTNNQEKWEIEFDKEFILSKDFICFSEEEEQKLKSFLRQEIRNAKIEEANEIKDLLTDHYFDSVNHHKGMILFHTDAVINQAISNLKKQ
jgi:hypothetical protein